MRVLGLGPTELIIILVIILVLFGPKRLPQLGKSLGQTMRSIREGAEGKLDDDNEADEIAEAPVKSSAEKSEESKEKVG
jgi:sec-independent protein translocase protein TatA